MYKKQYQNVFFSFFVKLEIYEQYSVHILSKSPLKSIVDIVADLLRYAYVLSCAAYTVMTENRQKYVTKLKIVATILKAESLSSFSYINVTSY